MRETAPVPPHAEVRYEKSDARIGGVLVFGVILIVMVLISQATVVWLFDDLKERENRRYQRLPSLAARERAQLPRDLDRIPEPRLQASEPGDVARLREKEESLLGTYGWVDRKEGVVRIPIDEAMRLLADPKTAAAKGVRFRLGKEGGK